MLKMIVKGIDFFGNIFLHCFYVGWFYSVYFGHMFLVTFLLCF